MHLLCLAHASECTTLGFAHLYVNQRGRAQMCRSRSSAAATMAAYVPEGSFHQSILEKKNNRLSTSGSQQVLCSPIIYLFIPINAKMRAHRCCLLILFCLYLGLIQLSWTCLKKMILGWTFRTNCKHSSHFYGGKGHNKDSQMSPPAHQHSVLLHANIIRDKKAPSNCKDNFHLSSSNTCLWFLNCRSALRMSLTFIQPGLYQRPSCFYIGAELTAAKHGTRTHFDGCHRCF